MYLVAGRLFHGILFVEVPLRTHVDVVVRYSSLPQAMSFYFPNVTSFVRAISEKKFRQFCMILLVHYIGVVAAKLMGSVSIMANIFLCSEIVVALAIFVYYST